MAQTKKELSSHELQELRMKLDNEEYLTEAIQRIALVLSNELFYISRGGKRDEQQRKRRK
ncbi:hypothetical protein ACYULU_11100 [Breznakiellaceae bacterium SP9]